MKSLLLLLSVLVSSCVFSQYTIAITSLPDNTPEDATIFFAGSINGWNPGSEDWTFSESEQGLFIELPENTPDIFQGKITRGSWSTVEGNAAGGFLPDRTFDFSNTDLIEIEVLSWEDLGGNIEWPDNLYLVDDAFFIPELNRNRRIRILLPSNYFDSDDDYPVLYMHDGQNLFVDQESFAGEWEVDEAMLAFENLGYNGALIVAIDNGGQYRIDEYTPWANPQYGGGEGEEYVDFVVSTLKPFIDETYRTLPAREHNGIMGSSLGGLISHYAAIAFQDVFSKVGVFSPSYWYTDDIYEFTEFIGHEEEMKFYILGGGEESPGLFAQIVSMISVMEDAGFNTDDEINFQFDPEGQHSEWFWAEYFPDAFEWLYLDSDILSSENSERESQIAVYPNPTKGRIKINSSYPIISVQITDQIGRNLKTQSSSSLDLGDFESGLYYLIVHTQIGSEIKRVIKL